MSSKVSGLLAEATAPSLQENLVGPSLRREFPAVLPIMTAINEAHILMLRECGIIDAETAAGLARAVVRIADEGPDSVPLDAAREDTYFNYEARIIELSGADIGGRSHIARSRNDLKAAQDRLRARALALRVLDGLVVLRATLLRRAALHAAVVMPGYTHLQPAQPITFGWYLLGIAHALERDHRRLAECFARIDVNPLGTGAIAGTSFPVDRALTARLLGFAAVSGHAQDAVASRDFLVELIGDCAMLANTWGRMAQDFFVMSSYEFGTLRFPDSVAGTSSMMPQKKNLVVLESLKGRAATILGAHVAAFVGVKGTNFTNVVDGCRDAFRWAWDALDDTIRGLAIADTVVDAAEPVPERMLALARTNFSTATDLADGLVREAGLPFREAHHLVGAIVRTAMDRGLTADRIDAALVAEESRRMLGRAIHLDADVIARIVDPVAVAEERRGTGGPSRADIAAMQAELGARLAADGAEIAAHRARIAAADAERHSRFRALAGL
ncbi:MAG: argininosuccinate lyase [Alphaproteobacteria bacterium]|nr:argininosuccinate lyase [Alphaproteobacteria bacterium]